MIYALFIVIELTLLYLLSHRLTKIIYAILLIIFRSHNVASGLLTFLYLPGTAIHELSHLITAEILRVPTGELSFAPEIVKTDAGEVEIKAGFLKLAKTDPLRRFLIGIAPVIWGLAALSGIIYIFQYFWPQLDQNLYRLLGLTLATYLLFSVGNNMFSSPADLEGAQYFLPVVMLILIVLYIMGVRLTLTGRLWEIFSLLLMALSRWLAVVVGINVLLIILNSLVLQALLKLMRIRRL